MLKGNNQAACDIYLNLEWLINIEMNVNWNNWTFTLLCGLRTTVQVSTIATLASTQQQTSRNE